MPILLELYLAFFKIGLFGFGGGYAMISLVQQEITSRSWLSVSEFVDIIAIAEMTPGPIAINSATYVGYKIASLPGSVAATLGVITPSFVLILILAGFLHILKDSLITANVLRFLRPAIIGLILAAALSIGEHSIVDVSSIGIALSVIAMLFFTKVHPIGLILLAGVAGVILY